MPKGKKRSTSAISPSAEAALASISSLGGLDLQGAISAAAKPAGEKPPLPLNPSNIDTVQQLPPSVAGSVTDAASRNTKDVKALAVELDSLALKVQSLSGGLLSKDAENTIVNAVSSAVLTELQKSNDAVLQAQTRNVTALHSELSVLGEKVTALAARLSTIEGELRGDKPARSRLRNQPPPDTRINTGNVQEQESDEQVPSEADDDDEESNVEAEAPIPPDFVDEHSDSPDLPKLRDRKKAYIIPSEFQDEVAPARRPGQKKFSTPGYMSVEDATTALQDVKLSKAMLKLMGKK